MALFLVVFGLLCGLLAGCGGSQSGSDDSQGGQQQGGEQEGGEQQGGEAEEQGASQEKVALGTIESVDAESRKVVMTPEFEAQGGEEITFNVRKNAEISVGGEEADLSAVEQGQTAQVEYVTKNDINRATAVEIVDGG
jgi:hypothetical protein